ncbi:MAG: 23S rRNA (adenine(2503)-C(2))-methyltransferase RlmN [Desulfococcaceae bacterium]|jgi:23S rRNA (adenine2503-C2)-methyltransferase|nr:23S rRNA (adenine(2503)-C(2))-methyltransferase RlmN [Desulfococcaceae bacterium]
MNTENKKTDIRDLTLDELTAWLAGQKIAPYRAGQIFRWLYQRHADGFGEMTDLGKDIRKQLHEYFFIGCPEKEKVEMSWDRTRKFLFRLADGNRIESVLIPEKDHYTLCVSTQAGCAQGCRFCMTAKGGLHRNLSSGEIIAQIRDAAAQTGAEASMRLRNLVFMGMGEPLANYPNLKKALDILTDGDCGMKFSPRHVTVSTAGLVPMMEKLGKETDINLAVSLNAADNETRSRLMPINRKYPLDILLKACKNYPLKPRQRITFEYILIRGINDSPEDARKLVKLLRPIKAKLNLIPFNTHSGSEFQTPREDSIRQFQKVLTDANYTAVIRHSKGADISAACGQLSASAP